MAATSARGRVKRAAAPPLALPALQPQRRDQPVRPMIDAVAISSSSSAIETRPDMP